jgi:hypothetical protein
LVGWGIFTVVAYVVLLAVGNGEEWASNATYIPYDGSIVIAFIVLAFVVKFYGTKSFEGKVWMMITAGLGLWMAAELIWGFDMLLYSLDAGALPTVLTDNTDYPFLAGYVFIAAGFFYKMKYTKIYFDQKKVAIVLGCAAAFAVVSAMVVVAPVMASEEVTDSEKFFQIAYIALDIVLFATGLAVALYWGSEVSKGWYVLAAGLLSMMIADVGYSALDLEGIYFDGALIELAWVFAYLLIGLAGHYQKKLHASFM